MLRPLSLVHVLSGLATIRLGSSLALSREWDEVNTRGRVYLPHVRPGYEVGDGDSCETDEVAMTRVLMISETTTLPSYSKRHPEIYAPNNWTGCWKLVEFAATEDINSAIWQRGKRCALAMGGIKGGYEQIEQGPAGIKKFTGNWLVGRTSKLCGYTVYDPFVRGMHRHFGDSQWENMMSILSGPQCSDGVIMAGSSLGAAFTSLFAACSMEDKLDEIAPHLKSFPVDSLITFGMPAISVEPLRNRSSPDGCMRGTRFVIGDHSGGNRGKVDFVPMMSRNKALWMSSGSNPDIKFPMVHVTELADKGRGITAIDYACDSLVASAEPQHLILSAASKVLHGSPQNFSHHIEDYVQFVYLSRYQREM